MADNPNVAGPDAATPSRAMTSAPASFPAAPPPRPAFRRRSAPEARRPPSSPRRPSAPACGDSSFPVLILAALGYGGKTAYDWFVEGRFLVSTDDAYVGANTSIIAAKVMGHLTEVPVVDNQVVHKGDLLVSIDDGDYQNAVDAAKARIATQDATIARFGRQIDAQGAVIAQAEAQVGSAAAQEKSAEADVAARGTGIRPLLQARADEFRLAAAAGAGDRRPRSHRRRPRRRQGEPGVGRRRARGRQGQSRRAARRRKTRRSAPARRTRDRFGHGGAQSFVHARARALRRGRRQQGGRGRKLRAAGNAADGARADQQLLRRRQFQGDPTRRHPARAEGRRRHRRARRAGGRGRGVVDFAGLRRAVLAAAAGQRDRQFHQGRPARRGAHHLPRGSAEGGAAAARPLGRRDRPHPRSRPPKPTLLGALGLEAFATRNAKP